MDDQQIVQTDSANQAAQRGQQKPLSDVAIYRLPIWPAILVGVGLALAAGGGTWWLWSAKNKIADYSDALTFFAQNTLSFFVFLAVVAQALIYFSQRKLMHHQLHEIQRQSNLTRDSLNQTIQMDTVRIQDSAAQYKLMTAQAHSMEIQAHAAKASVKHGEEMLRISQRAYVGVKIRPAIEWDETGRPIVILFFTNTGHTPTQEAELTYEFTIGGESFKGHKEQFTIGAHTDKSIDCVWRGDIALGKERRDLIDDNEGLLFFEAELTYWDVWDEPQDPVILRYIYNPKSLAMEEFFEGDIQHQEENEEWNSKIDPSLG